VVVVGVQFDCETLGWPVCVQLVSLDERFIDGGRQASAPDQVEKAALHTRARERRWTVEDECIAQASDPAKSPTALDQSVDVYEVEQPQTPSVVQGAPEVPRIYGGEIEQGSRDRGNRGALRPSPVLRHKSLGAMHPNRWLSSASVPHAKTAARH
jgi:hypothetical protein